jgi:excisionase family DNA binding protein
VVHNRHDPADQHGRDRETPYRLSQSGQSAKDRRRRMTQPQQEMRSDVGPVAYDVPEVMRRLGITRPTLYNFLRSGELRSFRLGTRRLVSAEALVEFIRSRETAEAG